MKTRDKLWEDADPAALATATMASLQGGLPSHPSTPRPPPDTHRPQRSAREPPPRRRLTMGGSAVDIEPTEPNGGNPWRAVANPKDLCGLHSANYGEPR